MTEPDFQKLIGHLDPKSLRQMQQLYIDLNYPHEQFIFDVQHFAWSWWREHVSKGTIEDALRQP